MRSFSRLGYKLNEKKLKSLEPRQFQILLQMLNTPLRGSNVPCVPLGFYGIDLRQHPRAQLIIDPAGLDDIPERFGGSR